MDPEGGEDKILNTSLIILYKGVIVSLCGQNNLENYLYRFARESRKLIHPVTTNIISSYRYHYRRIETRKLWFCNPAPVSMTINYFKF